MAHFKKRRKEVVKYEDKWTDKDRAWAAHVEKNVFFVSLAFGHN